MQKMKRFGLLVQTTQYVCKISYHVIKSSITFSFFYLHLIRTVNGSKIRPNNVPSPSRLIDLFLNQTSSGSQ